MVFTLALCLHKDPGEEASDQDDGLLIKENELYAGFCDQPEHYFVTVLDTEASERCLLAGEFTFLLDREAAFLLDKDTAAILYRWPYIFLRRFGVLRGGFCIEPGHQCDSGEGMFSFLSPHGHRVCQSIGRQCWSEREAMEDSSSSSPQVCDVDKVLLNTVHPSSPPTHPHQHPHQHPAQSQLYEEVGAQGDPGAQSPFREGRDPMASRSLPTSPGADAVYSLVRFPEPGFSAASPPHHPHPSSGLSSATSTTTTTGPHPSPTPSTASGTAAPVKPLRRTMRLSTKGSEKTETKTKTVVEVGAGAAATGAGPLVDRSPSGPQRIGAPLSFKQKLSKLISIDLAKLQFPRRFGKGKS